jgi:hypothetical protein
MRTTDTDRAKATAVLSEGVARAHWQATGLPLIADLLTEVFRRLDKIAETRR